MIDTKRQMNCVYLRTDNVTFVRLLSRVVQQNRLSQIRPRPHAVTVNYQMCDSSTFLETFRNKNIRANVFN